ncbi:MAG: threonylcarbamoyl-AMP synthase [Planctomycetia bacterium]|nr:threonylcarbamoyl-AMP synthase [Planctomycetia bacterium]
MPRPLPDVLPIRWPAAAAAPEAATDAALDRAATVLRDGGLVAIPTETVYGLAAVATDDDAVARIFSAKGRPAANPLIVHVADVAMARGIAGAWPAAAERLAAEFWPGPVTLVVPRGPCIAHGVTAGGDTVAIRCPAHPLTRRLIQRVGAPLAAPSANRSLSVSPTTAAHVLESLGDRVDLILDGGPCARGIESTVVDCTTEPPLVLRPGPVGARQLATALGEAVAEGGRPSADGPARAPGQSARHYAPRTRLEMPAQPPTRVADLLAAGRRVGWLTTTPAAADVRRLAASRDLVIVPMPSSPEDYAAVLYATLHALDKRDLATIVVDPPPDTEPWRGILDRLTRAATPG